jgi:hypothetical protein
MNIFLILVVVAALGFLLNAAAPRRLERFEAFQLRLARSRRNR